LTTTGETTTDIDHTQTDRHDRRRRSGCPTCATSAPDVTEKNDLTQRHRVPTADAVARAPAALAEITARQEADAARAQQEKADHAAEERDAARSGAQVT